MAESTTVVSRLEARVKPEVYELIREASELEGVSISAFVISAAAKAATERLDRIKLLRMARVDQAVFADALLCGPQPRTEVYKEAAALHDRLVR